jgi:hypothetical protein
VEDLFRVTGLEPVPGANLRDIAIVYSGRSGIAPDVAPLVVLQAALHSDGQDLDALIRSFPAEWYRCRRERHFQFWFDFSLTQKARSEQCSWHRKVE